MTVQSFSDASVSLTNSHDKLLLLFASQANLLFGTQMPVEDRGKFKAEYPSGVDRASRSDGSPSGFDR